TVGGFLSPQLSTTDPLGRRGRPKTAEQEPFLFKFVASNRRTVNIALLRHHVLRHQFRNRRLDTVKIVISTEVFENHAQLSRMTRDELHALTDMLPFLARD